ncbi:class I SAM-dependent methyltransferase [Mongoliimonas terrestris]|uniref:class I SAM-dependent methyltransferase n=1 Tax=Mongoliimonas terrestris TaxID=1709001 RepID=UPI000A9180A4|nr:class I SAM-dependent methyltransferase [Mongoliimonas terrestris]
MTTSSDTPRRTLADEPWFAALRADADRLTPALALARLAAAAPPAEARLGLHALIDAEPGRRLWRDALALADRDGDVLARLRAVLATVDHRPGLSVENIAAMFDAAVAVSPEAGVALHSLGDPALLAAATAEIVDVLAAGGLLAPDRDVLDVGCGIGRMALALAPRVRTVVGLDIAPAMVTEAKRRCAGLSNVRFAVSDGRDMAEVADLSVDCVLFVDAFPYVMLAGGDLPSRMVRETGRVLRPAGSLVLLNMSYRADPSADAADFTTLATAAGLTPTVIGHAPFRLWDGLMFRADRI